MGRRLIEVMQLLVDQIHKAGYQHRALEDDIYAESQKRIAAEKDRDAARAEIETLRQQLAEAHAPAMAQQSEEIAYLRARLDEERSVIASLRQQLESALALLTGQRLNAEEQDREIERLRKFANGVRSVMDSITGTTSKLCGISEALAELDAQPAPATETAEGGE